MFWLVAHSFLLWQLHGISLTLPTFSLYLCSELPPGFTLLSHWPKATSLLTNGNKMFTAHESHIMCSLYMCSHAHEYSCVYSYIHASVYNHVDYVSVCACMCLYLHSCICSHSCACVHICLYLCACVCVLPSTCIHMSFVMFMCIRIYMHVCIFMCMCQF